MTILLLTHSYPDTDNTWRGSFIRDQALALSSDNKVIAVYFKIDYNHFTPFAKPYFSKAVNGNLTEYKLVIKRSFPVVNQANYLIKTYRFLNKEIFNVSSPQIIHSHLAYPAGFLGTITGKLKKIPVLITEHSRISNYFRSSVHRWMVGYALKNASCMIAVSKSLRNEILPLTNKPVEVIHNIVDIEKFNSRKKAPGDIMNIGFLGNLRSNNKGLDLLIKSAAALKKGSFRLHIGGEGILMDDYKKLAEESGIESQCIFYGEIDREKIVDFFLKADLFVLPSRYETFGVVLIEAMACGIPVIATKCGGPEDIVTKATGLLIEKDNVGELTSALLYMLEHLDSYNKETIISYAREHFGKQAFIKRTLDLYNEILKNNSNG